MIVMLIIIGRIVVVSVVICGVIYLLVSSVNGGVLKNMVMVSLMVRVFVVMSSLVELCRVMMMSSVILVVRVVVVLWLMLWSG